MFWFYSWLSLQCRHILGRRKLLLYFCIVVAAPPLWLLEFQYGAFTSKNIAVHSRLLLSQFSFRLFESLALTLLCDEQILAAHNEWLYHNFFIVQGKRHEQSKVKKVLYWKLTKINKKKISDISFFLSLTNKIYISQRYMI